jgi:hypothetical protein
MSLWVRFLCRFRFANTHRIQWQLVNHKLPLFLLCPFRLANVHRIP